MAKNDLQLLDEPLWFKDAVIYELASATVMMTAWVI